MKLIVPTGELTLPNGFKFEIKVNNPFFSDEGSCTLPVNLPPTSENLRLLGFPNRICRGRRYEQEISAILGHGPFFLPGTLIVGGVTTDGISCVLSLIEGSFYSRYNTMELRELVRGHHFPFVTRYSPSGAFFTHEHLWEIYVNDPGRVEEYDGLSIFPVCTTDTYLPPFLNQPNAESTGFCIDERDISDSDGNTIRVPQRYGLSVFVYLGRLTSMIFEQCGYEIKYNVFEDKAHIFSKIVVLNSCADAFTDTQVIMWDTLVPDITVGEFIAWLKDKFGAGVFLNGNKVEIKLLQDCIESSQDMDLSNYVRGELSVTYPTSKRIVSSCDTSIEGAEPPTETMQDFQMSFPTPTVGETDADITEGGFHFNTTTGRFYRHSQGQRTEFGSNAFVYDRKNSVETDERKAEDCFVPMKMVDDVIYPVIGDRIHIKTTAKGDKEDNKQKILICWAEQENGRCFGTSQGEHPLTPEGLFPICWEAYNNLLLNSVPELECQIDFPTSILLDLDISMPKIVGGLKVMVKSYSYVVSDEGIHVNKVLLQSLANYKDGIRDEALDLTSEYCWIIQNTLNEKLADHSLGIRHVISISGAYTQEDIPSYYPKSAGIKAKRISRTCKASYTVVGNRPGQNKTHTYIFSFEEYFLSVKRT